MSKKRHEKSTVTNATAPRIENGIGEAMGLGIGGGLSPFGLQGPNPFSAPVSSAAPLLNQLRWYFVSNDRALLSQAYVEIGLIQTIVDVPVDDALKGGIEIKSKQLDEDEILELQTSLERDDDLNTIGQAAKWTRLYGGGGLIVLTDQNPKSPLDIEAIEQDERLEFRAVDMWELFWNKQNEDDSSILELQDHDFEMYDYRSHKVHKSRVMRMKGKPVPSFVRPRFRGWGLSVVETLVNSVNQYLKSNNLSYEVLDEFKLDIYKLKNLASTLMSPVGEAKVRQRMQTANLIKNYQNAIVLDSEDDFDHKQLSFAGLAEAMEGIRMQVASDMRIPITKLFGQSVSKGMGNTDQNDIENYNSMVESSIRSQIKYDVLRVCEMKCQKLFGFIPDDLKAGFQPLRELSAEQEENVKTQKFARLLAAKQQGEISTLEFRDASNRGALFDITLDTTPDELNPDDPEIQAIVEEGSTAVKAGAEKELAEVGGADKKDDHE